jgi:hypothetical protein
MRLEEINMQKLDESQDSWCYRHQGSADLATQGDCYTLSILLWVKRLFSATKKCMISQ